MIFIEGASRRIHQIIARPCLWNQRHHDMRQWLPGGEQQFDGVIQTCGVGTADADQRVQFRKVVSEQIGGQAGFSRPHPVPVAIDGIDFAVMGDVAVWMGKRPGRERIGREALMHQRNRRGEIGIGQILIVGCHLTGQQ